MIFTLASKSLTTASYKKEYPITLINNNYNNHDDDNYKSNNCRNGIK